MGGRMWEEIEEEQLWEDWGGEALLSDDPFQVEMSLGEEEQDVGTQKLQK
jgi:hypothetical protein